MQATLSRSFSFFGIGLHSGQSVRVDVHPAAPGHGIVFMRSDVSPVMARIPVSLETAEQVDLCTGAQYAWGCCFHHRTFDGRPVWDGNLQCPD